MSDAGGADEELQAAWASLRAGERRAVARLVGAARRLQPAAAELILRSAARAESRSARDAAAAGQPSWSARQANAMLLRGAAQLVSEHPQVAGVAAATLDIEGITGLAGQGVNNGISLTWNAIAPVTGLLGIVVNVFLNGVTVATQRVSGTATGTTVTGLANGTTYQVAAAVQTVLGTGTASVISATAGTVNPALPTPTLNAAGAPGGIAATWSATTAPTSWLLVISGTGLQRTLTLPGTQTSQTVDALVTGLPYTLTLQGIYPGTVLGPSVTVPNVIAGLTTGTPFTPLLLQLQPFTLVDPTLTPELSGPAAVLSEIDRLARRWTADHLASLARAAATKAAAYDTQIVEMMNLTLSKSAAGENLFTSTVLAAIETLQDDTQEVASLLASPTVDQAITDLASAATTVVTLQTLLTWLVTTDAIGFWLGLLDALVKDVASFDFSFGHVGAYIDSQYQPLLTTILTDVVAKVDAWVATLGVPLSLAVQNLVGAADRDLAAVYTAFDLPLTLLDQGTQTIPNFNPLVGATSALQAAVVEVITTITGEVTSTLQKIADGQAGELVRAVILAYIIAPIAAALVVGLLGGPIAAAVIAALLTIGAEELIHLIIGWITGPISAQLAAAEQQLANAEMVLANAFAAVTSSLNSPGPELQVGAGTLQQLATLLPQAFLEEVAGELGSLRNRALAQAQVIAAAAERAYGRAYGTAFDAIASDYTQPLSAPAPQMPGGDDPELLAAARLLADVDRLDRQVLVVSDGVDNLVTYRISLAALADRLSGALSPPGGTPDPTLLTRLLSTGRMLLDLTAADFFDRNAPGLYRQIVSSVSATVSLQPSVSATQVPAGVPVALTHLGSGQLRVKVGNNPSAPPMALPPGYPDISDFANLTTYSPAGITVAPFPPNALSGMAWTGLTYDNSAVTWENAAGKAARFLADAVSRAATFQPISSAVSGQGTSTLVVQLDQPGTGVSALRISPSPGAAGITVSYALVWGTTPVWIDIPTAAVETVQDGSDLLLLLPAVTAAALRVTATAAMPASLTVTAYRSGSFDQPVLVAAYAGSSTDPNHPASNLYGTDPTAYWSTVPSFGPGPDQTLTVSLQPGQPMPARIRLLPRTVPSSAPGNGFPASGTLIFQLQGAEVVRFDYSFSDHTVAKDIYFAPQNCDTIILQAAPTPTDQGQYYAVQLSAFSVYGYVPPPPSASHIANELISAAVVSALTQFVPPNEPPTPQNAATAIGQWLSAQLPAVLAVVYRQDRAERMWHIAKWSGATLAQETDPVAAGLGYAVLTTADSAELAVLTDGSALANPDQPPPLAGRGLQAHYLLEVPADVAPALQDIVLVLTARGCTDPDLGSTLRAATYRQRSQLEALQGLATTPLQLVGGGPGVLGSGRMRYQTSMRAERDRMLRTALAGLQLAQGTTDISKLAQGVVGNLVVRPSLDKLLSPTAPLTAFGLVASNNQPCSISDITLSFASSSPTLLDQSMFGALVLAPDLLGFDPAQAKQGSLLALAVAIIPTQAVAASDTLRYTPTVGSLLAGYVPSPWSNSGQVLVVGSDAAISQTLDALIAGGSTSKLSLGLGSALQSQEIYDVIVSAILSPPASSLTLT